MGNYIKICKWTHGALIFCYNIYVLVLFKPFFEIRKVEIKNWKSLHKRLLRGWNNRAPYHFLQLPIGSSLSCCHIKITEVNRLVSSLFPNLPEGQESEYEGYINDIHYWVCLNFFYTYSHHESMTAWEFQSVTHCFRGQSGTIKHSDIEINK